MQIIMNRLGLWNIPLECKRYRPDLRRWEYVREADTIYYFIEDCAIIISFDLPPDLADDEATHLAHEKLKGWAAERGANTIVILKAMELRVRGQVDYAECTVSLLWLRPGTVLE